MNLDIAIAQIKPRKADYVRNLDAIGAAMAQLCADPNPPDVLVLPETALSGYFLEGGVREIARARTELFDDLLRTYRSAGAPPDGVLDVAVGFYELHDGKYYNSGLYCTLTGADDAPTPASIGHVHRKFFLPTYGVFDEKRFVARGRTIDAFETRFGRAAVLVCEDVWHSVAPAIAALKGAQILYILSASPGRDFGGNVVGNLARWDLLLPGIAEEHSVFVVYAGLVGFEGGKGFTGSSRVVDPWGRTLARGPVLDECIVRATVDQEDVAIARAAVPLLTDLEAALSDVVLQLDAIARKPHEL